MKKKRLKWLEAIGYMLLYLAVQLVVGLGIGMLVGVFVGVQAANGVFTTEGEMIIYMQQKISEMAVPLIAVSALLGFVLLLLIVFLKRQSFKEAFEWRGTELMNYVLAILVGVAVWCVDMLIVYALGSVPALNGSFENFALASEGLVTLPIWIVILVVGIFVPFVEECLMRGMILKTLRQQFPVWFAIVLQGLLFGILHMNLVQGTYAFVMGIILGCITVKTRSLWPAVIAHMVNNVIAVLVNIDLSKNQQLLVSLGIIGGIVVIIAFKMMKTSVPATLPLEEDNETPLYIE